MSRIPNLVLGFVFGLAAFSLVSPANAIPRVPDLASSGSSDVINVRYGGGSMGGYQGGGGSMGGYHGGGYRPIYRYNRPHYRPYYSGSYNRPYRPHYRPYYHARYPRYYRPYYGNYYWPYYSPFYAGYYGGFYGSYDPYYEYYPYYSYVTTVNYGTWHQQWCRNHYRSYNPATNTYLSYSGVYRVCRSPAP